MSYFYEDEGLGLPQAYGRFYQNVSKQDLEIEGSIVPSGHFWHRKSADQFLSENEAETRGRATQILIDKAFISLGTYVPTFTGGIHIQNASGYVFRLDAVLMNTPLEKLPYAVEFSTPGSGCLVALLTDPNGSVTSVKVLDGGSGYATPTTATVYSKTGSGAVLKPRVRDGRIFKVDVITQGTGYGSFEEKDLAKYFAVTVSATRLAAAPGGVGVVVYPNSIIAFPYGLLLGWPSTPDMGWGGTHYGTYQGPEDLTCAQFTWEAAMQDMRFDIVPLPRHIPVSTPVMFNPSNPLRFAVGPSEPGVVAEVSVDDDGRVFFTKQNA